MENPTARQIRHINEARAKDGLRPLSQAQEEEVWRQAKNFNDHSVAHKEYGGS